MYLRFGKPPADERSGIYIGGWLIGYEIGVSCWDCIKIGNEYRLVLPKIIDSNVLNNLRMCYNNDESGCSSRVPYILDGEWVGYGHDGEPLLRNVRIVEELDIGYFKVK